MVSWLTTSTEAGVCSTGNPSRLALPATAPVFSGVVAEGVVVGVVGVTTVAGAPGGRTTGACFGRPAFERPLGGGEVTTTRGSSVPSGGCAVSAALGLAASSASNVNDELLRNECTRPHLRPPRRGDMPHTPRRTPRHRDIRSLLPFAPRQRSDGA